VLRARRLVGVRGAGTSYDGFYWVKRVTHTIRSGNYTQQFNVSREGTGALLPVVVP
jgi:phage protein D